MRLVKRTRLTAMDWDLESDSMHWNACRANTPRRKAAVTTVSVLVITAIVLLVIYYQPEGNDGNGHKADCKYGEDGWSNGCWTTGPLEQAMAMKRTETTEQRRTVKYTTFKGNDPETEIWTDKLIAGLGPGITTLLPGKDYQVIIRPRQLAVKPGSNDTESDGKDWNKDDPEGGAEDDDPEEVIKDEDPDDCKESHFKCNKNKEECKWVIIVNPECTKICEFLPANNKCWGTLHFTRSCEEHPDLRACQGYCCRNLSQRKTGTYKDLGMVGNETYAKMDKLVITEEMLLIINHLTCKPVRLQETDDLGENRIGPAYGLNRRNCEKFGYLNRTSSTVDEETGTAGGSRRKKSTTKGNGGRRRTNFWHRLWQWFGFGAGVGVPHYPVTGMLAQHATM